MKSLLPVIILLLAQLGCRPGEQTQALSPGKTNPADGWLVYEDDKFKVAVPPASKASVTARSSEDSSPELTIRPAVAGADGIKATFVVLEDTPEMMRQDAAEAMLKRYIGDGSKALTKLSPIPMRTGNCVGFAAVSGAQDCGLRESGRCHDHWWVGQCDAPNGKRYLYMGDLGSTANINFPPPGFKQNLAVHERIMRSIEFKKGSQ